MKQKRNYQLEIPFLYVFFLTKYIVHLLIYVLELDK